MKKALVLVPLAVLVAVAVGVAADSGAKVSSGGSMPTVLPASQLFDHLGQEADVIYLIANSSVVFGPDPHGRSEEVTFVGPVTVPKWPMKGYGRRVLPDGRQQIDMELTQSELTGESYVLAGPVVLGEHPDLRSLGTITERPRQGGIALASNKRPKQAPPAKEDKRDKQAKPDVKAANGTATATPPADAADEPPADFVVLRKVLLTTAKGILYNETAVPVRGRIDSIPPVKFENTQTGVNVFRGMELPVALLDKQGNVNGWFYSKAHMAYAVKPQAIEREYLKGTVALRSGDKTENVAVSGPVEIHHLTPVGNGQQETSFEVMVMALRGHSDLLGGDVMFTETFSDRDHFSRGKLAWQGGNSASSAFDLYVDLYTPSDKLTTHEPLAVSGSMVDFRSAGRLEKGKLSIPMVGSKGHYESADSRVLYNEAEKPVVRVERISFDLAERM
jgi:hypothetical protein